MRPSASHRNPSLPLLAGLILWLAFPGDSRATRLELEPGARIVILGNALAEGMTAHSYFEAALQCAFPNHNLLVRNMGWSGDQVSDLEREPGFGDLDSHLFAVGPDLIFAFFGFNESFGGSAGIPKFRKELAQFIRDRTSQNYNGKTPPELVLVSPVPYRQVAPESPREASINANLRLYRDAMREICIESKVRFLDILTAFEAESQGSRRPFTDNGIHLNAYGHWMLSKILADKLGLIVETPESDFWGAEAVRRLVTKKNLLWLNRWRPVHSENTREDILEQKDRLIELADRTVWNMEKPGIMSLWTMEPTTIPPHLLSSAPVPGAYPLIRPQTENRPNEVLQKFALDHDLEISLWASERDVPISKPVAMNFDERGRLWVLCAPSSTSPDSIELPDDYLLILEDEDMDHVVDSHSVFARGLQLPTGFTLAERGAVIAEQRTLVRYLDRDDNGVADQRKEVFSGFGAAAPESGLAGFQWGPDGSLWFSQGQQTHSRVETAWGVQRISDQAILHYSPRSEKLEMVSNSPFIDRMSLSFDGWGRGLMINSQGNQTILLDQIASLDHEVSEPHSLQTSSGGTLLYSPHFPKQRRTAFVRGSETDSGAINWFQVSDEGSVLRIERQQNPLLKSDGSAAFSPIAYKVGPDGAFYILDAAMDSESASEPHQGRVWRLSARGKREYWRQNVSDAPIEVLLEQLRSPEPNARKHVRRELWTRSPTEVFAALNEWSGDIDYSDDDRQRLLTELLWLHQAYGRVDSSLLSSLTESPEPKARAAAARVLGDWHDRIDQPLELLAKVMEDEDPRVRLAALSSARKIGSPKAGDIATLARHWPMSDDLQPIYEETCKLLGKASGSPPSLRAKAIATSNADLVAGEMTPQAASVLFERKIYEKEHLAGLHRAAIVLARRQGQTLAEYFVSRLADQNTSSLVIENIQQLLNHAGAWELHFLRDKLLRIAEQSPNSASRRTAYAASLIGASTSHTTNELAAKITAKGDFPHTELLRACEIAAENEAVKYRIKSLVRDELAAPNQSNHRTARFVRIVSPNTNRLSFTELEVIYEGTNLASGKTTSQFTAPDSASEIEQHSSAGVNGITNLDKEEFYPVDSSGDASAQGVQVSSTDGDDLWWEVDLGEEMKIESVILYTTPGSIQSSQVQFELRDNDGEAVYTTSRPSDEAKIVVDIQLAPERIAAASAVARKLGDDFKDSLITVAKYAGQTEDRFTAMRALSRMGAAPDDLKIKKVEIEATAAPSYQPSRFSVNPRTPVEMTLTNKNASPVNVVLMDQGAEDEVGKLVEAIHQSDAKNSETVPASSKILHATGLVTTGASTTLQFLAPSKPGAYPFRATTPGHWQVLKGILTVVAPKPPPEPAASD
tara:strand:- start:1379 stop:5482 length:4104 start_codon:yes stop_codon:yes gene_type:complete